MNYIHVKNLERYHPGYKDRKLHWCKAHFEMLNSNPDFEMLHEIDKWRFLAFIMLELQLKKAIPINENWLTRKGFDCKNRPISLTLDMLHNYLDTVTEDQKLCVLEKSRVEESRGEKKREDKNTPSVTYDKELLQKVFKEGFNIYSLIGRFKKERGYDLPKEVIEKVCSHYILNKESIKAEWPWFIKSVSDASKSFYAGQNIAAGKVYKDATRIKEILK